LTPAQRKTTEMLVKIESFRRRSGPGALECGAANYIDVQMADYLQPQRDAWVAGLDALDAFAKRTRARHSQTYQRKSGTWS